MATPINVSGLLQVDGAGGGTTTTFNAGFVFTAGNDAIFEISYWDVNGVDLASVTIGGTAAVRTAYAVNGQWRTSQWLVKNMAGGTPNVVVTWGASSSTNYASAGVQEFDAADDINYDTGTANSATGTGTTPSVATAASTSQNDTVVVASVAPGTSNASSGISGPTGWTLLWTEQDDSNHIAGRGAYIEETTVGTKTATFGLSVSGGWAAAIAAYTVAGSSTLPSFTTQPASSTIGLNVTGSLTWAATSNGGTELTTTLQLFNGSTWDDVLGATSPYTVPAASTPGTRQYRVVAVDTEGTTYSSTATITVSPPAVVAVGAFASGTGALTVAAPTGTWLTDGSALDVIQIESANQTIATPSGFTEFTNSPQSTGTAAAAGGVRLAVFYKPITGALASASVADSGNHTTSQRFVVAYCDPAAPVVDSQGSVQASAATGWTFPAVTTSRPYSLVVNALANDRDAASTTNLSGWTNAALTDLAEHIDQTVTAGAGGGLGMAAGVLNTAGDSGQTTVTNGASTTAAFLTIAFQPVAEAATGQTVKVWNGSAFVDGIVKRWNGSAWVDVVAVKHWSGSAWV